MKITTTKDYSRFVNDKTNRPAENLKKIMTSMKLYGSLPQYPITVRPIDPHSGKFLIQDGQHRFEAAKALGLCVHYVVCDSSDIPIADINAAQTAWNISDFVGSYAQQGKRDYQTLIDFKQRTGIPTAVCASLLYGHDAASGNVNQHIKTGTFKIRDVKFAERVAEVLSVFRSKCQFANKKQFIDALGKCVRVEGFSSRQLIDRVIASPHMATNEPTTDMFLEMLDRLYNFRSREPFPLAFSARNLSKQRSAA